MKLGNIKASFTPAEVEEWLSCWKRLTRQNLPSCRPVDNDGGGGQFAVQHCMHTGRWEGGGGQNGEMVREVRLICGRVAESRWSNWRVAPRSRYIRRPLAQLQLPITASAAAGRRASPWSSQWHNCEQSQWHNRRATIM